jgi:DNA-binding ferritin-like protein
LRSFSNGDPVLVHGLRHQAREFETFEISKYECLQKESKGMKKNDAAAQLKMREGDSFDTPTDLDRDGVVKISNDLRELLADVFALYVKTKNFHWHMSGPHFRDYHLLLDEHASQIFAMTDDIAERARKNRRNHTPFHQRYRATSTTERQQCRSRKSQEHADRAVWRQSVSDSVLTFHTRSLRAAQRCSNGQFDRELD